MSHSYWHGGWSCGPAFLTAYDDTLDGNSPHIIDDVHPPYEIRTAAIVEAATRLGWNDHTASLRRSTEKCVETDCDARDDVFLALWSEELVDGVVAAALEFCSKLSLPRCDLVTVAEVKSLLARGETPSIGRSLILASWLTYEQCRGDKTLYYKWEIDTVNALVQEVSP